MAFLPTSIFTASRRNAALVIEEALSAIGARKLDTTEGNRKEATFWTVPDVGVVLVVRYLDNHQNVVGCELMIPASTSLATHARIEALHQWVSDEHAKQPETIGEQIAHLGPCEDAVEWLGGKTDWQAAWDTCPRGDWLLWLYSRLTKREAGDETHRTLVRIACACARTRLSGMPAGELRPLRAVELAERWAAGEDVPRRALRDAADAADVAAAYAAATATAAAHAAYAADAADAAAYITTHAAAHAAIVRKHIPLAPRLQEVK